MHPLVSFSENAENAEMLSWMDEHFFTHDDIVSINVSGERFQTFRGTLNRFPETLLGDVQRRRKYQRKTGELYFDRHSEAFESILYYYQSGGELCQPNDLPLERFIEEIDFFDLRFL